MRYYSAGRRWSEKTNLKLTGQKIKDKAILVRAEKIRQAKEKKLKNSEEESFFDFLKTCIKSPLDRSAVNLFALYNRDTQLQDLDLVFFDNFIDFVKKQKNYKQSTKRAYISFIMRALKKAYRAQKTDVDLSGFLKNLPAKDIDRFFLDQEEVKKIIDVDASTIKNGPEVKAAFVLSICTGLRYSDLRTLNLKTEIKNNCIKKRQIKTGNLLDIPLNDPAAEIIKSKDFEEFLRLYKDKVCTSYADRILKAVIKKAGIEKKVSFHTARRTHAYLLLDSGADIYTVSKILGHKKITTTQIYSKVDKKKEIAEKSLNNLFF